jgi:hypothetical protein
MPPLYDLESIQLHYARKTEEHYIEHHFEKKQVRFCDDVSIKTIPNVPAEFKLSYWMNKQDYANIRKECTNAMQTAPSPCFTSEHNIRGLEHRTSRGLYRRMQNRQRAYKAVLEEQLFQAQTGYSHPDWIASVYREISHRSMIEAKIMGMRDEIATKHEAILNGADYLHAFGKKNFNDFKKMASAYVMAERMEM